MTDAKIKINVKEGTFEIEGSENFVEKYWNKLENALKNMPVVVKDTERNLPPAMAKSNSKRKTNSNKNTNQNNGGKSRHPNDSLELIPLDLSGKGTNPSLKEFVETKSPKTSQEMLTVLSYYLTKYLEKPNMKYGEALFCFDYIKKPKPNIKSLFVDTRKYHKWVDVGTEPYTVKLTIAGDNLVQHELPKK